MINDAHNGVQDSFRDIQRKCICSCTSGTDAIVVVTNVKNSLDVAIKKVAKKEYKAIQKTLNLVAEVKETLKELLPSVPGIK